MVCVARSGPLLSLHLPVEQQVRLLLQYLIRAYLLEILVVKIVPTSFTFGVGDVVTTRECPVVHRERKELVVGTAACGRVHLGVAELSHVQMVRKARLLLNLAERRVEPFNMKYENFGEAHERVSYLRLRLFVTALARVEIVNRVLIHLVRDALQQSGLVLQ